MVTVVRYEQQRRSAWDDFVAQSKNGTFLFNRDYMEYHADRFPDHSLMLYERQTLVGLLPGSPDGSTYRSHPGLTYGGIVSGPGMGTARMLACFGAVREYLAREGMSMLLYKPVPHIYHATPAEEDLYALFRTGARLCRRDVSSSIYLPSVRVKGNRNRGAEKARSRGVDVREAGDMRQFLGMVDSRLREKYGVHAVHSPEEMERLRTLFPDNIRLFGAFHEGAMVAGALVYQCGTTAHVQYLSSTPRGRELRAVDLIVRTLVTDIFHELRWFDFGISTEQEGTVLNESLIKQKEEFGASAICYDSYGLELSA
jgi:hypothetical protein